MKVYDITIKNCTMDQIKEFLDKLETLNLKDIDINLSSSFVIKTQKREINTEEGVTARYKRLQK